MNRNPRSSVSWRLVAVLVVLSGLSAVFALPDAPPMQESALRMSLPSTLTLNGWIAGPDETDFSKERGILAGDTEFRRRNYYRSTVDESGTEYLDVLQTTLVLSGYDLNNSLHRPERCLPAQGFQVRDSRVLAVPAPGGRTLKVTRLRCEGADQRSGTEFTHLNYYFFVGHDAVTGSHYSRTFQDMSDRLFNGYNQRWAYVTVAANLIGGKLQDADGRQYSVRANSEEDADRLVTDFIAELLPEIMDPAAVHSWH